MTASKSYGKLLVITLNHIAPWATVHTDMVGPWKVQFRLSKTEQILTKEVKALTIVDRATAWPEFAAAKRFTSAYVTELFDSEWLCRYPRPVTVIHDNGGEFTGNEFQELLQSYGIEAHPTTVKNPRANSIAERVHLTMADMLRCTIFEGDDWFTELNRNLQSVAWAVRSTVSTATNHSPGNLAFNHDMIMQMSCTVNWELIKQKREKLALLSNARENSKRLHHEYKAGDQILVVLDRVEQGGN